MSFFKKHPIQPTWKSEILPLLLVVLSIFSSFYFYKHFPEQIVSHWDWSGQPNAWMSKFWGAFSLPFVILGIYLLFLLLPVIDPKKARYSQFKKVYHVFKGLFVLFMTAIYFITSLNALGYPISVDWWVPIGVGLLFVIIGNYLSKIKTNWFVGIKTPWTLSSEIVWNKTHRFGGKMFILAGLIMMIIPFFPSFWRMVLLIVVIVIMLLSPFGYSYIAYLKEKRGK